MSLLYLKWPQLKSTVKQNNNNIKTQKIWRYDRTKLKGTKNGRTNTNKFRDFKPDGKDGDHWILLFLTAFVVHSNHIFKQIFMFSVSGKLIAISYLNVSSIFGCLHPIHRRRLLRHRFELRTAGRWFLLETFRVPEHCHPKLILIHWNFNKFVCTTNSLYKRNLRVKFTTPNHPME